MSSRKANKMLTVRQAEAKLHKIVTFRDKGNGAYLTGQVVRVYLEKGVVMFSIGHVAGRGGNVYEMSQDKFMFL